MSTLVLRGGHIADGRGNPARRGDLVVADRRIRAVTRPGHARGDAVLDVDGLTVAPGFIDMHAHSDLAVLADPDHRAKLAQGVTLEVVGQDGLGYAPATDQTMPMLRERLAGWNGTPDLDYSWRGVADYLERVDAGAAVNVATLVPHGTVRMNVMGMDDRRAEPAELARIREQVAAGLRDGAVGLSTGLTYAPGMYASDDEIVDALEAVRVDGGYYCPHHRNYGSRVVASYAETIAVAERARVPLHLAHCHVNFPQNAGRAGEVLALVDAARARGVDVSLDSYPYLAGATTLAALLPGWAQTGGVAATLARLEDAGERARILHEIETVGSDGHHGIPVDWDAEVVSSTAHPEHASMVGRSIAAIAGDRGAAARDVFVELLAADRLATGVLERVGNEENMLEVMRHPAHTVGTDGILVGARPHPRGWGSFPRFLGHYARDRGLLPLEEAIAHATSRAAARLGLTDRGVIAPGYAADLVVFDADTIDAPGDEEPPAAPTGVVHVLVNGAVAVRDGQRTGVCAGRAVRRPAHRPHAGDTAPGAAAGTCEDDAAAT